MEESLKSNKKVERKRVSNYYSRVQIIDEVHKNPEGLRIKELTANTGLDRGTVIRARDYEVKAGRLVECEDGRIRVTPEGMEFKKRIAVSPNNAEDQWMGAVNTYSMPNTGDQGVSSVLCLSPCPDEENVRRFEEFENKVTVSLTNQFKDAGFEEGVVMFRFKRNNRPDLLQ